MERDLTDLSGIGAKTAEKLREDGIDSPGELAERYRRNPRFAKKRGKRVADAAKDALFEQRGSFVDPASGVEVTEDDRLAYDKLATRRLSDFNSISVDAANSSTSPDDEIRKFIKPVTEGRFSSRVGGDDNLMSFAADAAENLGADTLDSGELQDLNRAADTASEEVTLRKQSAVGTTKAIGTTTTGDFYQAVSVHQQRSPKARRVDNRREAEKTTDFREWRSDPSRHDFPGVDTPERAGDVFPEERTSRNSAGFGSSTLRNSDRGQIKSAIEEFSELNDEQRSRIFEVEGSSSVAEELNDLYADGSDR
jgi:hypothetical protein